MNRCTFTLTGIDSQHGTKFIHNLHFIIINLKKTNGIQFLIFIKNKHFEICYSKLNDEVTPHYNNLNKLCLQYCYGKWFYG